MFATLTAVASYWRWGLVGLTVLALLFAGYTVNNWRRDALDKREAVDLLLKERKATQAADAARALAEKENRTLVIRLQQKAAEDREEIRTIIREVPRYVERDGACVYSPDAVRLRNRAASL